jgi:hypothetical protein
MLDSVSYVPVPEYEAGYTHRKSAPLPALMKVYQ